MPAKFFTLYGLFQQSAGDSHSLNFAGTFVDLSDLRIAHHTFYFVLSGVTIAAVQLYSLGGNFHSNFCSVQFCLCSFYGVGLLSSLCHSSLVNQKLSSLNLGCHISQLELCILECTDRTAKLLSFFYICNGSLKSTLCNTQSLRSDTDTAAIQELMSRVSAGNKPFKGIEPTLTETENDMANENKTQGFEYGAIAASLGMKDGEVKDVMARISELAAMEPKYREIQKSLSDAQTVIAGKDASIRNLQTDLAAATARLSAYEQKEKDEQASRIETLVENAIAEGKIDREAKTQWVEMAGSNFELAESTLASIPAREKISKEIADDPANIQATAEATKTAEQLMAEKVAEVVGADFKFRKL